MPTEAKLQNKGKKSFFKTDFAKMGGTALVTSLIFLAVIFSSEIANIFAPASDTSEQLNPFDNELISANDLINLRNAYNNFKALKTLNNGKVVNLECFVFSTAILEDIIHTNKKTDLNNIPIVPENVMFYLGEDGTFPAGILNNKPHYKLIAIGMKGKDLMLPNEKNDYSNKFKSSIYDKASPCPGPGCPPPPPPVPQN